jgi:hypothetical protein
VRYLQGPKRGLLVHFFDRAELEALFTDRFDIDLPMRCDRTRRPRPGAGCGRSGRRSGCAAVMWPARDAGRRIPVPRASWVCNALPCGAYCFALPGSLRSRDACRPMGDIEQRKDAARRYSRGRIDARIRGAPGSNPRRGEGRRTAHRARRTRRGEAVPCRGRLRSGPARPSQGPRYLRDPATPSIRRRGRVSRPADVMSRLVPADYDGEG